MMPMASLDDFESILKEVVQAKRLSASKMMKLTEIALKSMEHDTQIVSILYRTHKSLPTAAKVSSLYVFDALSRAARHQVNKQGLTGDMNSTEGNCATFLLKVEGVLEGLFQDMIMVGSSEAKEKTKKILDIWVKGNTFPSAILSRLTDVVKEKEKVPEMKTFTPSDPRTAVSLPTPPTSTETPVPAGDPQATLLALLAQAANAATMTNPPQTNANTGLVAAGLDAAQLALLQQLALAQTASSAAPSAPSQLAPHAVPAPSGSSVPSPSYRDKSFNTSLTEGRHDRHHSPERVNAYDNQRDDRETSFRGARGGFRGRGSRSRWDDRDRDRYKGRDSYRGRRSRSRSPPSRYARRDMRPYSPPRRPALVPMSAGSREQESTSDPHTRDIEKDEFGRDIRPKSPESDSTPASNNKSTNPSVSAPIEDSIPDPSPAVTSNHERMSLVAANTSSSTTSASIVSNEDSSSPAGMENFDPKTFDPTSAESWQVLGKMWQVTYGCTPSTEQLMQFAFAAAAGQASVSSQLGITHNWSTSSAQVWRGTGRGGGFTGGRGTFEHGNARDAHENWTHDGSQTTDAVVLGGSTGPEAEIPGRDDSQMNSASSNGSVGSGGRMQRIGDKWVFVRDSVEMTS